MPGFWLHKTREDTAPIEVDDHYVWALANPRVLGLSTREIAGAQRASDPREALILQLMKKGWIRAREHRIGPGYYSYTFEVWGLDQSALGAIMSLLGFVGAPPEQEVIVYDQRTKRSGRYRLADITAGVMERELVANPAARRKRRG